MRRYMQVAGLLLALVVGVPTGYAVASLANDDPSSEVNTAVHQDPSLPTPEEFAKLEAGPTLPENGREIDYFIEGPMDESVVSECREDPENGGAGDPLTCEMIIAVSEGRLDPGEYSTDELERALGR